MSTTVQPETPPSEPSPWAEIAAELHRIADDLAQVEGRDLAKPRSVRLTIQPGGKTGQADDNVIATVDTVGQAVLGKIGSAEEMSGGTYHYDVEGIRGLITFAVYREISAARVEQIAAGKVLADKEAELERLRAEVAELRAAAKVADEDDADGGFAFGQDDHLPLHFLAHDGITVCGLRVLGLPAGEGTVSGRDAVTCEACVKGLA